MKIKIIRIIALFAAIIAIVTSIIAMITGDAIPVVMPLSISVTMIGLLFTTKKQFEAGKVKKDIWQVTCILGSLGAVSNFIIGILQLVNVISK